LSVEETSFFAWSSSCQIARQTERNGVVVQLVMAGNRSRDGILPVSLGVVELHYGLLAREGEAGLGINQKIRQYNCLGRQS
jgi:hypothetical protein